MACLDRPLKRGLLLVSLLAGLSACGTYSTFGPMTAAPSGPAPTNAPMAEPALENTNILGMGPVRVGMILPLTQGSGPSLVGTSLRNAADLAISESGGSDISLMVFDDQSSPEGASSATQTALAQGAELIIGPLYANNVREASRLSRGAGKSMIAFSTDTTVASRGTYLLSFLVEGYVNRIVDFASQRGKKSFAALVPENEYGTVALAEFQQAAARHNVRVQAIERYAPGQSSGAIQRIAAIASQIDAVFIPEQADAMASLAAQLTAAGLESKRVQIIGTGLWNDARVLKLPALQGAWFSAPENGGFNAFAQRYRAKFGSDPTRLATLAYDAVSLAAALARSQGTQRYSESVLTNPSGFNGADGIFRFSADGQVERGLSVLQINNGTTSVVSPAPRSFGG
ncbi:MAG: penicillin-binding protein activator [Alphaproteobacteria bacterium]|nr:penicillin-binding protein activator [Alphaproteobacteria bacterium]